MKRWLTGKHLVAMAAVGLLFAASNATEGNLGTSRGPDSHYFLPGQPLPAMNYSEMFAAPEPVRRVADALATPLEAAAERLRPIARLIFPSLWDESAPEPRPAPYTVRDSALRLVRETI